MTERINALTVVLEQDMREDDVQHIIDAIALLRFVLRVDPHTWSTTGRRGTSANTCDRGALPMTAPRIAGDWVSVDASAEIIVRSFGFGDCVNSHLVVRWRDHNGRVVEAPMQTLFGQPTKDEGPGVGADEPCPPATA